MSWERCALGLPTVVVTIADNQVEITKNLAARDVVKYAGHYDQVDAAKIWSAVKGLMDNPDQLQKISENAMAMCDGGGCKKVYEAIGFNDEA